MTTRIRAIRVFDVTDDGRLICGRVFVEVGPAVSDGFRLDTDGNVWTSTGDGVPFSARADGSDPIRMKAIGLLGGMSWESTQLYYQRINEGVRTRLGGLHSARVVLVSVDFAEIEALQSGGRWEEAGDALATAARQVEAAGADCLLICTNTMHKVAPSIEHAIGIPLLHLADATAERIRAAGMRTVGLLGTRFTMEEDFYRGRLRERHGLDVVVPSPEDRAIVHRIIYEELCLGIVREESRREYLRVIGSLREMGAEGVIEGCTEITMLVRQEHTAMPLFDTTAIHAEEAVAMALGPGSLSDSA